jgi:hypothetical protein
MRLAPDLGSWGEQNSRQAIGMELGIFIQAVPMNGSLINILTNKL